MSARSICGTTTFLVLVLAGVACTKQLTGSGTVVSRQFPVTPFSKIQVSNAFAVRLSIGSPEAVTVRVDDNLVDDLDIGVSDGTLRIGLKGGMLVSRATLEADVTASSLSAINGSGASTITPLDPIKSPSFVLAMSGASRFDGAVAFSDGSVELSGASEAVLMGSASTLTIMVSGASHLQARDLSIGALTIDLSGASRGEVHATGTISASASGASTLGYVGSPTFTRKDISGGSQITQL
jgi:putative autotransporter adhesin-like protein